MTTLYIRNLTTNLQILCPRSIFKFISLLLLNKILGKVPLPQTLTENLNHHQSKFHSSKACTRPSGADYRASIHDTWC